MAFRIYADESGTHDSDWLIIGMLFVPNHGSLHADLCKAKDEVGHYNTSPKHNARYKEVHLTEFRSPRDLEVGKRWIDVFAGHNCYYRCVVIDWSLWKGKFFGDAFEPDALKRRRAYKKWAEMLLQPELRGTAGRPAIQNASFYLDRLKIMQGYDVVSHLKSRFTRNYKGSNPYITDFQHAESWKDAHQCLQLCDLLTGCLFQALKPSSKVVKLAIRDYLSESMRPFGIERMAPGFWKQYEHSTLNQHLEKFSAWFWKPQTAAQRRRRKADRKRKDK